MVRRDADEITAAIKVALASRVVVIGLPSIKVY